jgi:hypothetical protein
MHLGLRFLFLALLPLAVLTPAGGGYPDPPLQPILIRARATLKGVVTLTGKVPGQAVAANDTLAGQMKEHRDAATCLAAPEAQQRQQEWVVGPRGGVANVAVFVRAEPGHYLELTPADLQPFQTGTRHEAVMDQPFCAFVPHTLVTFPAYYKEGKLAPSGQVVKIKNNAPVAHNSKWGGSPRNPGTNPIIPAGAEFTINLVPDRMALPIICSMHAWMGGWIWALDTPFATVTDRNGAFAINDVPAGVKLRLFAWHDSGWVSTGRFDGEAIELEAGKVVERKFVIKGE